ncbi:Carnitine O-palmitoyltransferase 2 mitochondrial, partial [Taenia solium]
MSCDQQNATLMVFVMVVESLNFISANLEEDEAINQPEVLKEVCASVEHFRKFSGPVLQDKLWDLHYLNPNCMSKILLDSHLKDRRPVAVNHNSVYILKRSSLGTGYNNPVLRAAVLVYSSLRFLESLRRNKLRPDIHHANSLIANSSYFERFVSILPSVLTTYGAHAFKVFPLDMSHYKHMFHSTRIPDFDIDRLESYPEARHIVVLSQGEFYTFNAFDDQNKMISAEQLVSNLAFIRNRPRSSAEKLSVGLLTAMNRDDAAIARQLLRQVDGDTEGINTRNLALIDAAIMVLIMCDDFSEYLPQLISTALAGPGGSRWFDKSFSLLVDRSGVAALNFDYSWTDASTALRFAESIFRDSETRPSADPWLLDSPHRLPTAVVRRLEWHLDETFYENVLLPQRDAYDALRDSLQVDCLVEVGDRTLTRRLCACTGVCADAMMQLAFLMAHEKVHGEAGLNGGSTESRSIRTFRGGYTALLRPFTTEMREFLRLARFVDTISHLDEDDLLDALHRCSRAHRKLLQLTTVAQDWDGHLFALKQLAEKEGTGLPDFFMNKAYVRINTVDLYTTPLTSDVANGTTTGLRIGAFAPTSPHGYGISYGITV